jgi:tetratricopeptide (TPR) repeat protein
MVDPAGGPPDNNGVSIPFLISRAFFKDGGYLVLRDEAPASGIHRKIQILDRNGIIALRWFQRGVHYSKSDDYDSARICYMKALHLNPEIAEVHNNLGIIHSESGQFDSARERFERCIALNPGHAHAYYNLGNEYQRKDDLTGAMKLYAKAIELDPRHAKAYNAMGELYYFNMGSMDSARACFRRALASDSGYARARSNLAYLGTGRK